MIRPLKRLGLALSLCAIGLLTFHVDHADAEHSSPTHHCCPCHFYSVSPEQAAPMPTPAAAPSLVPQAAAQPCRAPDVHAPGAARAPPVS